MVRSPDRMTVIYFFFGHFSVFWVFFTLVRVTIGLLAIYIENLCGGDSRRVYFFNFTEKIFLCLMGNCY